jgi:hypothetical protein
LTSTMPLDPATDTELMLETIQQLTPEELYEEVHIHAVHHLAPSVNALDHYASRSLARLSAIPKLPKKFDGPRSDLDEKDLGNLTTQLQEHAMLTAERLESALSLLEEMVKKDVGLFKELRGNLALVPDSEQNEWLDKDMREREQLLKKAMAELIDAGLPKEDFWIKFVGEQWRRWRGLCSLADYQGMQEAFKKLTEVIKGLRSAFGMKRDLD